ncbi:MAG: Dabb family protein [Verrucomicrobiales bacterium]|nr:Dabb family protein [Verrucomicrobiales bacterium]MBT6450948.1 Dabb family protein [Verrucomicrobiales bacterium]
MKYFIATFLILTVGCVSNHQSEREQALSHVVLCWLKEPGNTEHRNQIIEVSKTFTKIPGVLDVRVGKVIESNRSIVDDSFDVGILVVVLDAKRLQEYLDHPIHQNAKRDVLLPLVEKVLVYDFQE